MLLKRFCLFATAALLSACATSVPHNSILPNQTTTHYMAGGAATGAVIGAAAHGVGNPVGIVVGTAVGGYLNSEKVILARLKYYGVRIVQIGDTTSFLLPVDSYFDVKDDLLEDESYPAFNLIAKILNKYGNAAVKIAVSTDDVDSDHRNYVLARRQAERIAAYLWQQGVDDWRLYPVSYGPHNLLATNRTLIGSYYNRIIEITFNPYVKPSDCCRKIRHFVAHKQEWQFGGLPYTYREEHDQKLD